MSILKALKKMATTSKKVALSLDEQFGASGTYYRFNVERGLEDISLADWDKSSTISSYTHNYLNENKREMSNFTGRKAIINTITNKLFKTDGCNRVALLGLGGVGKTQIALHMAHWAKNNLEGYSVFWMPAFSMAGFEQECVQLVKRLRIPCTANQDAKEVVQQYLNSGSVGKWFMIVDNADDTEVVSCFGVALCLHRDLRRNEAVVMLEHIVILAQTTLSQSHALRRRSTRWLAIAYESNGQPKRAVEILENLVEAEAQTLPEDNLGRQSSQQALGNAYLGTGQVNEAVAILKSVAQIQDRSLAPDDVYRLYSQHLLADAYLLGNQPKEAMNILEPLVKVQYRIFGNDNPDQLTTQYQLARAYRDTSQSAKAMEIIEPIVEAQKKLLAEDDSRLLASERLLAIVYIDTNQSAKAVDILESVIGGLELCTSIEFNR
ncbi:hypothetical protein ACHAP8_011710 [Fusarium lateritium]